MGSKKAGKKRAAAGSDESNDALTWPHASSKVTKVIPDLIEIISQPRPSNAHEFRKAIVVCTYKKEMEIYQTGFKIDGTRRRNAILRRGGRGLQSARSQRTTALKT